MDEVRDEEGIAYNYRKELADLEIQLKKQQNLYHAVRNDKNILNKGLTEAHDEISDLKGKLRVLNHQFDQVIRLLSDFDIFTIKIRFPISLIGIKNHQYIAYSS